MMGFPFWSTPHEAKDCVWSEIWYLAFSCDRALLLQDVVSGGRKRIGKYSGSPGHHRDETKIDGDSSIWEVRWREVEEESQIGW